MGFRQRTNFQYFFSLAYEQADNYDEWCFWMAGAGFLAGGGSERGSGYKKSSLGNKPPRENI
jgi:hypothetical protein